MTKVVRLCQCGCDAPLTGRQLKYASEGCSKRVTRDKWLRLTYNITLEEYDLILEFQGGICPICERKPRVGETFHVDHLHDKSQAGPVRGVVCGHCNVRIIGRLKLAKKARNMANYLEDPPATRALGGERIAPGRKKVARRRRTSTRRKKI